MKRKFTTILALVMLCAIASSAQERDNAFVAGFEFSIPSSHSGSEWLGQANYYGGFRKYEIYGAYEAFLWKSLFVMPGISLWYSDNYDDVLAKTSVDPSIDSNPDLKRSGDEGAWQIGGTISAMAAWRQPLTRNFSLDLLTGPRLDINFKSKVKGWGHEFDNLYRPAMFAWRFGAAANIHTNFRIGVNFDLRPGKHKDANTGVTGLYWVPSGEKRHNAWSFSVGYRF